MEETKEFKTETKRLLDLMINSIYTNKEIFLRELISNASDATDKYYYLTLVDKNVEANDTYQILIEVDKDLRTIQISDEGIGMTYDEVVNNLGTVAKSGSLEFLNNLSKVDEDKKQNLDIIGQFGVGFYSAFMVAEKVVVETKSPNSDKGYRFESFGLETYNISEIEKSNHGTKITLYLRKNTEDDDYDVFLNEYHLSNLVKKYSDYIRYPIKMYLEKEVEVKGENDEIKYEKEVELETLNSMIPLWKKNKSEVKDEDLNEFYKNKFNDYQDPLINMFIKVEGNQTYNSLLFIPKEPAYNLYSEKYEKGLQLYTKGVFIMDKCKELIPDYLRFVRGLVDSSDLSLNISREILQHDRQLQKIASNIEKKILNELQRLLKNEREKYLEFYKSYGINLKYGVYDNFGEKKDLLKDLLLFNTLNEENMVSFKEIVSKMPENQKEIYYASGKNKQQVLALPQLDLLKKQGFDCLILTDDVDEFMMNVLREYDGKQIKSINQGDLNLISEEEKNEINEIRETKKPLIDKLKELLKDDVNDVIISERLIDSPVCLVSGEGISFEMEKVLSQMPNNNDLKANRILELNCHHDLFKAIEKVYELDENKLKDYADILYNQALLIEGLPLKDPVEFSNKMVKLMIESVK